MTSAIVSLAERRPEYAGLAAALAHAADIMVACALADGWILACGNGGSAADAGHLVGELMKGFLLPRRLEAAEERRFADSWPEGGLALARRLQRAVRAIALTEQSALMSAVGNDLGFDLMYAQQVQGYGRPGDVLVAFSTSGMAANVIAAARVARARGMKVVGFSGGGGGTLAGLSDAAVLIDAEGTPEIQLGHLAAYHALCAEIEERLFGSLARDPSAGKGRG